MDFSSDSKPTDHRTQIWTTQNNIPSNGGRHVSNTIDYTDVRELPLHISQLTTTTTTTTTTATASVTPTHKSDNQDEEAKRPISDNKLSRLEKIVSWRFVITLLLQTSLVVSMLMRHCLPMALVCMVKPRRSLSDSKGMLNRTGDEANGNGGAFSPYGEFSVNVSSFNNTTISKDYGYEFDWSSEVQGLILTSIMFSFFLGPIVVTVLTNLLGSKLTMTLTNILSATMTFLSPLAARMSPYCLVVARIILGVSLGGINALIGDTVAWWAPQDERLTMIGLAFTGINVGSVLSSFISGYLCLVPFDNGWPFVFYTFGSVSVIWGLCWHFLSTHKPEDHPYISEKEKRYILAHRQGMDARQAGKKIKTPYRKILTSPPVLAYVALCTCFMWSNQIITMYLPSFFNKHMGFSIQETGLMTSLTSLFRTCGSLFWTSLGNKLMSIMGTNKSRKTCIAVGLLTGGVTVSVVGFFDEGYKWVVLGLLLFSMLNQTVRLSSVAAIPLDMAPRYAGVLSSLATVIGGTVAFSAPLLTAAITTNDTQEEWRNVWIIVGSGILLGALIFLPFGKASLQPWAQGKQTEPPHVMSSLVALGRRFSVFAEAPPLTPVNEEVFVFSKTTSKATEDVLALPHPKVV